MGIYIDFPDGLNIGKAARLINQYGAEEFIGNSFADVPKDKVLVCIAENREGEPAFMLMTLDGKPSQVLSQESSFDAAVICYSQDTFDCYHVPDETRTVREVLLDKDVAIQLAPELVDVMQL